jgi:predicted Mrr-cat superfamily restriction endonuclease
LAQAKKKYGKGSKGVSAFVKRIQKGHFVWVRNRNRTPCYYLGRITGNWEYRGEKEYTDADTVSVRQCDWVEVGLMDNVPGAVINNFRVRKTVLRVNDANALIYSQYLFAKLNGESLPASSGKLDVLQLLSDEDLEDVAAAYLQLVRKAIMLPSTCKTDTKGVECFFTAVEDGQRIGLQVKGGQAQINQDDYADFNGTVYLFQANQQYAGQPNPHCVRLSHEELRNFLFKHRPLMPGRIQQWMDFATTRGGQ